MLFMPRADDGLRGRGATGDGRRIPGVADYGRRSAAGGLRPRTVDAQGELRSQVTAGVEPPTVIRFSRHHLKR